MAQLNSSESTKVKAQTWYGSVTRTNTDISMKYKNRIRTMLVVASFSLILAACGGGGGDGGTTPISPPSTFRVTVSATEGGTVSSLNEQVTKGETAQFVLTPDSDYSIESVDGCGGSLEGNTYTTGTITADCSISVTFVYINKAPVLSLLGEISVGEKNSVTVTADALDPEDEKLTYQWTQTSGEELVISDAQTSAITIDAPLVDEDTEYTVELVVTDIKGESVSDTLTIKVVNDEQPPLNVKIVSGTGVSTNEVSLDWLSTTDNFTSPNDLKYEIYVSDKPNFTPSPTDKYAEVTGIASTNISGLSPDTTYYFVIKAEDVIGNGSFSNKLSAKTMAAAPVLSTINTVVEVNDVTATTDTLIYDVEQEDETPGVGDIVVSAQETGLLREVTSVSRTGNSISVETTPASLNQVYEELALSTSIKLIDVPDVDSVDSSYIDSLKAQGLIIKRQKNGKLNPTQKNVSPTNTLEWEQSQLTLSHTTQNNINIRTTSATTLSTAPDEFQEVKEGKLMLRGMYKVLFRENVTNTFEVSARVINDINDEYEVSKFDLERISHNTKANPENDITVSNVSQGSDNNKKDLLFIWSPTADDIDFDHAQPYIAVFKATVQKRDCKILCDASTALLSVEIYVGETDIPKTSSLSIEKSADITIAGTGSYKFEPTLDVSAILKGAKLKSAHAKVNGNLNVELTLDITANAAGKVDGETEFARKNFVKVIVVGGAPIIVRGEFGLSGEFHADAKAKLAIKQKVSFDYNITAGFEYDENGHRHVFNGEPTSANINLLGSAEAELYAELRLVPELQLYFYEVATAHVKVEPYLFGETKVQGVFEGNADLYTGGDFIADYGFDYLRTGVGMDLNVRAGLEVIEKSLIGWPSEDQNHFELFTILNKTPLYGLPEISVLDSYIAYPENSCEIEAVATVIPIPFPYSDEIDTFVDWDMESASWELFPIGDDDSEVNFYNINSKSYATVTVREPVLYKLRFSGHSELGAWANQFTDQYFDFTLNENGLPNYWALKYGLNDSTADKDNDGLSNIEEFNHCTWANDNDSDDDGILDGWEANNQLDPLTAGDSELDSDEDGRTNLQEYHDGTDPHQNDQNPPPVVDAGIDQVVFEGFIDLLGSFTDAGAKGTEASSIKWTQISGPETTVIVDDKLEGTFVPPVVQSDTVLTYQLEVVDSGGAKAVDTVDITVLATNEAPLADAGSDQTIIANDVVTLDGSLSTDLEDDSNNIPLLYKWNQIDASDYSVVLNDDSSTTPSFTAPDVAEETVLTFELTVTDSQQSSSSSTVDITVSPASIDLNRGLIAYYPFDGDAKDYSGNGNDAVTTQDIAYVAGLQGKAVTLNGTSDTIDAGNIQINNEGITLSIWVKLNPGEIKSSGQSTVFFDKHQSFHFVIYDNELQFSIGSGEENKLRSAQLPNENVWTHLAASYDGKQMRLFINGSQVATKEIQSEISLSNYSLYIASDETANFVYLGGNVDNVRIYDRALHYSEIQNLFDFDQKKEGAEYISKIDKEFWFAAKDMTPNTEMWDTIAISEEKTTMWVDDYQNGTNLYSVGMYPVENKFLQITRIVKHHWRTSSANPTAYLFQTDDAKRRGFDESNDELYCGIRFKVKTSHYGNSHWMQFDRNDTGVPLETRYTHYAYVDYVTETITYDPSNGDFVFEGPGAFEQWSCLPLEKNFIRVRLNTGTGYRMASGGSVVKSSTDIFNIEIKWVDEMPSL